MGARFSVAQQQWSPTLEPDDTFVLLERPRFLAIECAVLEHESQQLLRYETGDPRILERVSALYNATKYSLHWRWVRQASKDQCENDVLVAWITGHDFKKRCYRIAPHSVYEIDAGMRKKDTSYTPIDWLRLTVQKLGHMKPMWVYETDPSQLIDEYCGEDFTGASETSWQQYQDSGRDDDDLWNETEKNKIDIESYEYDYSDSYSMESAFLSSKSPKYYTKSISGWRWDESERNSNNNINDNTTVWPLHRFLFDLCRESLQTRRLPLVVRVTDNRVEDTSSQNSSCSFYGAQKRVEAEHKRLVWSLVHRARPGYEEMVRELRKQLYSVNCATLASNTTTSTTTAKETAEKPEKQQPSNCNQLFGLAASNSTFVEVYSNSEEEKEDDEIGEDDEHEHRGHARGREEEEDEQKFVRLTDQEITIIQDRLSQYLDFDDPWIQTGAEPTDPENEECVRKLAAVLKQRINLDCDGDADEEELIQFAKRKLERLRNQHISFVPDSFPTTRLVCHGLSLDEFSDMVSHVSSPFNCFCAHWVATHPILPETLRQRAWQYHDPSYVTRNSSSSPSSTGTATADATSNTNLLTDASFASLTPSPIKYNKNGMSDVDVEKSTVETQQQQQQQQNDKQKHQSQQTELLSEMYFFGKSILEVVEDYCIDKMIPRQRLTSVYLQYNETTNVTKSKGKKQFLKISSEERETLLSVFYLRRAAQWLCFWGKRGYGFVPRVERAFSNQGNKCQ